MLLIDFFLMIWPILEILKSGFIKFIMRCVFFILLDFCYYFSHFTNGVKQQNRFRSLHVRNLIFVFVQL